MIDTRMIASALALALMCTVSVAIPTVEAKAITTPKVHPVSPWIIEQPFRQPLSRYGRGHRGTDVAVRQGQSVRSPFAGKVSWVGWVGSRNTLAVTSPLGLVFEAEPVCTGLARGQGVKRNGRVGRFCPNPHYRNHCYPDLCAHLGLRDSTGYFSLQAYLDELEPSRLTIGN